MKPTIRVKTILMILPVIVASLAVLGTTSLFIARSGMMRLAMQTLSLKAELLKQYADSQWALLVSNGFDKDPDFVRAAQDSVRTSAAGLLRSDSEWFFAIDLNGALVMSVAQSAAPTAVPPAIVAHMRKGVTGAVAFGEGQSRRFGEAFFFGPFGWYVVASNLASSIFAEANRISTVLLWTFGVSILVAVVLLVLLATSIARPVSKVTNAIDAILRSNDLSQSIEVPGNDEIGTLTRYFNALCAELDRSYKRISDIAVREADARYVIAEREFETVIALAKVAEFRDADTGSHSIRVGLLTKLVAREFYADDEEWRVVYHAAPLHDLGKIGIPDAILLKRGMLDAEEIDVMQGHTTIGHSILRDSKSPILLTGSTIALTHHERYDGAGYPRGLAADQIPLCGRIVTVIDAFDALCSKRPYKEAWQPDAALDYLSGQRGRHFDPRVVDVFLSLRAGALEILATHQ